MNKKDFEYLLGLLRKHAGWEFDENHYFILDRKMSNFIREKDYISVEQLIAELKTNNKVILWSVIEYLALSDTSFYRDYKVFKGFENYVFPIIRENNRSVKKIRIWSLGCATGQEAYSVAFVIKKKIPDFENWDIDIIGTDLSGASILKAQKGAYTQFEVQMGLNARDIIENFTVSEQDLKDEDKYEKSIWQVNKDIMSMVKFRRYNILEDLTFSDNFDIIFCRNVLRFFDKSSQKKVIEKIFNQQISGGFLYLGMGEYVEGLEEYYDKVQGMKCLFKSKKTAKHVTPKTINDNGDNMPSFQKPSVLNITD